MYGFKDKMVAQNLKGFIDDYHRLKAGSQVSSSAIREDNTRLVRVGKASANADNVQVSVGLTNSEDYSNPETGFTLDAYNGVYLFDYFQGFDLQFEWATPDATGVQAPTGHIKSSLRNNADVAAGETASGDLSDKATVLVHNCCILPVMQGQIVLVHKIGRRWVYNGTHQVLGKTDAAIPADSWGDVTVQVFGMTETSPSTTFDFDSTDPHVASSTQVKAWNFFSEEIPSGKKCILGDVGGRICVMGWEC